MAITYEYMCTFYLFLSHILKIPSRRFHFFDSLSSRYSTAFRNWYHTHICIICIHIPKNLRTSINLIKIKLFFKYLTSPFNSYIPIILLSSTIITKNIVYFYAYLLILKIKIYTVYLRKKLHLHLKIIKTPPLYFSLHSHMQ